MADSRLAPSQWETGLLCNDVSHWLGTSLESALHTTELYFFSQIVTINTGGVSSVSENVDLCSASGAPVQHNINLDHRWVKFAVCIDHCSTCHWRVTHVLPYLFKAISAGVGKYGKISNWWLLCKHRIHENIMTLKYFQHYWPIVGYHQWPVVLTHQEPIIQSFVGVFVNSSLPGQNGCHFADDIFRCICVNEKFHILIEMSLKFVPMGPIGNNPSRLFGAKPLSEWMLTRSLTHICGTRGRWGNSLIKLLH